MKCKSCNGSGLIVVDSHITECLLCNGSGNVIEPTPSTPEDNKDYKDIVKSTLESVQARPDSDVTIAKECLWAMSSLIGTLDALISRIEE